MLWLRCLSRLLGVVRNAPTSLVLVARLLTYRFEATVRQELLATPMKLGETFLSLESSGLCHFSSNLGLLRFSEKPSNVDHDSHPLSRAGGKRGWRARPVSASKQRQAEPRLESPKVLRSDHSR